MNSPIANSTMDHRSIFPIDIKIHHEALPSKTSSVAIFVSACDSKIQEFILNDSTPDGYAAI